MANWCGSGECWTRGKSKAQKKRDEELKYAASVARPIISTDYVRNPPDMSDSRTVIYIWGKRSLLHEDAILADSGAQRTMIGDELHHIGSSTTSHLLFDSSANPGSCSNVVGEHLPPKRSGIPSTPIDMALSSESHRDSIGVSSHQPQPVKRLQRQGQREQSETVPITISSLGRIRLLKSFVGILIYYY